MKTKNETNYFQGEKVRYTGKSEILHGKKCYEQVFVTGYRKGETLWTYNTPKK